MKTTKLRLVKILTWRPKAPSKSQKEIRAMHSHHRAARGGGKCIVQFCNKTVVENSDHCAQHRSLLVLHVPRQIGLNVYGG